MSKGLWSLMGLLLVACAIEPKFIQHKGTTTSVSTPDGNNVAGIR